MMVPLRQEAMKAINRTTERQRRPGKGSPVRNSPGSPPQPLVPGRKGSNAVLRGTLRRSPGQGGSEQIQLCEGFRERSSCPAIRPE